MSVWTVIKKAWKALDYIPDCGECKGTGEPNDYIFDDVIWWKGKQVHVCGNCQGSGKV